VLTFAGRGTTLTAVMRRSVRPNRIFCLVVLAVSLHAVWPASNYNSRLELFNPSTVPSEGEHSSPVRPTVRVTYACVVVSETDPSWLRAEVRQPQTVHAAIPIYQKLLPPADISEIAEDRSASSLYSSCSIPRASGRGPPRLIA